MGKKRLMEVRLLFVFAIQQGSTYSLIIGLFLNSESCLIIFYWWKKNCGQTTMNVSLMFLEISCEYCMYGVVLEGLPWLWRAFNSVTEVRTGSGVVFAYPQTWSSTYQNE